MIWLFFLTSRLIVFASIGIPQMIGIQLYPAEETTAPALFNPLIRWDSAWYLRIATEGYRHTPGSTVQRENYVAFFPLYPASLSLLHPLVNAGISGILLSNAAFVGALGLLYRLQRSLGFSEAHTRRTLLYLCFFPTSFFFSLIYTESLFLLLTLGATWLAQQERWYAAAALVGLAAATRVTGVLLLGIIAWEYALAHGFDPNRVRDPAMWRTLFTQIRPYRSQVVLICLLSFSGLLAYLAYLQLTYDNAFAFLDAQANAWSRPETTHPLDQIIRAFEDARTTRLHYIPYYGLFEVAILLCGFALGIVVALRLRIDYALYALLAQWIASSSHVESTVRYVLVLFPLFMVLPLLLTGRAHRIFITVSAVLLGLFSFLFSNALWIG